MDGVALKGLTVDFHEPVFAGQIAGENNQPFWFQMSDEQRQKAGSSWGPANPQSLNRYSYVQNNPLGATDPKGHDTASIGVTVRGGGFLGGSVSVGITSDSKGGWGFYFSRTGGPMFGGGLGIGLSYSETIADTIEQSAGQGKQIGGDLGPISGDYLASSDGKYAGWSAGIGIGPLADVHGEKTHTEVLAVISSRDVQKPPNPCPNGPNRCGNSPIAQPRGTSVPGHRNN